MLFYVKVFVLVIVFSCLVWYESFIATSFREAAEVDKERKTWPICNEEIWDVVTERQSHYLNPTTQPNLGIMYDQAHAEHLKICTRSKHTTEQVQKRWAKPH